MSKPLRSKSISKLSWGVLTFVGCYGMQYIMFGRGGAIKPGEEDDDGLTQSVNELITILFVEQPLALPGSVNK